MREKFQTRTLPADFETREVDGNPVIEGYFAVFDSDYHITADMSESIAPGSFNNTLSGDVRALINHDTTLVLGRTTAHTLELRQDSHGLWGKISINPKDTDAMNLYERVKRGDVSQCSIGFDIISEETDFREDGSIHWTITEVRLHEVSCCTFPAYEDTGITARENTRAELLKRRDMAWKQKMTNRLKGAKE